jgi:hypothetical protein
MGTGTLGRKADCGPPHARNYDMIETLGVPLKAAVLSPGSLAPMPGKRIVKKLL